MADDQRIADLYEDDFYLWTQGQAEALRAAGRAGELAGAPGVRHARRLLHAHLPFVRAEDGAAQEREHGQGLLGLPELSALQGNRRQLGLAGFRCGLGPRIRVECALAFRSPASLPVVESFPFGPA